MSDIAVVYRQLAGAKNYLEVFGPCDHGVKPEVHIKKVYRRLARNVHPDKYAQTDEKDMAQEAFKLLGRFFETAKKAAARGDYGNVPKVVVATRRAEYEVGELLVRGEIADIYAATKRATSGDLVMKIARIPLDNDLLATEARALTVLRDHNGDPKLHPFFPELLDSFVYRDEHSVHRRANVQGRLEGWYTLKEVRAAYPDGVSPLDMAWIWRRLLWLLGYAHERGLLHGAVTPDHILILPGQHGVMLVDWCYSQQSDTDGGFQSLRAVSGEYQGWYPREVTEKVAPSFGTDIYMASRSMVYLMGGESIERLGAQVPRAFKAYFRGCMQENHKVRPQGAWELLGEFDELLERIGRPYFPRSFHPFTVPIH